MSTLLAGVLGLSTGGANAFTPNHLYVGGTDSVTDQAAVFEFDTAGNFVRKVLTGDAGDIVYGLSFGPDGNLYAAVIGARKVVRISPTFAVSTFLSSASGLDGDTCGVEFGPQGLLYVSIRSGSNQVQVYNMAGTKLQTYSAPAGLRPSFTTFGPDGHLLVALHSGANSRIYELDSNLRFVREFGFGAFTGWPSNVFLGRNGVAYVGDYSGDGVERFDATGTALANLPVADLNGPYGLTVGPDSNLYVSNYDKTSNQIIVANPNTGATVRTLTHPELLYCSGMAFAPYRFQVRLKGTLNPDNSAQVKLAESTGVLSISPGSRKVTLTVAAASGNNIAANFPATGALVFHGNDSASSTGTTYTVQGATVSGEAATRSVGSLTLTSKGSTASNGYFIPKTISGAIQLSRPGNVMNATFLSGTKAP